MRFRVTCAAVVVVLAVLPTAPAAAAPPRFGVPPRVGGTDVGALLNGRITLAKADAPVAVPLQTLRVYAYESVAHRGADTVSASRSWIVARPGADPTYGVFAPVTVSSHAGAAAVVATISQQQLVDASSGTYLPLAIASRVSSDGVRVTTIRASTLLRVSALQVDGAAVDVGAGCVTATALSVTLTGEPDFSDLSGGLLTGTFTLPAFTGCDGAVRGTGAVLGRALSGRGNTVTLARGAAGPWDTTAPRDCRGCTRPPVIA